MRSLPRSVQAISSLSELSGDDVVDSDVFIDALLALAAGHRAVNHPYLMALSRGDLPDIHGAILDFGHQYLAYSRNFLRYLTGTITQLEDPRHRQWLVCNLTEEVGQLDAHDLDALRKIGIDPAWVEGIPHPRLFERFLTSMGLDSTWRSRHPFCDEAVLWSAQFLDVCSSNGAAEAVGAIGIGTESVVSRIYRPVVEALDRYTSLSRYERVFFDLHTEIDDEHGDILRQIAIDLADSPSQRRGLQMGVLKALNLRNSFFDTMHRRALAMSPARRAALPR